MNDLHHNCELWAEPISLLAAGCLSTDEERDVRRHFETCPDCRERFGQLTQLCGALAEAQLPVNVAENAIVERVMSAVDSEESGRPLVRTQAEMIQPSLLTRSLDKWRWIMRSPVSRIAAAAIFVLAITGVAMLFQGGGGAAFAFADFAAPFLEAKTVKYKMTIEMKGPPARTMTSEMMMLDGARMRQVTELPDRSKVVMIQDFSQGKSLSLFSASKTATVLTSTKNRKDKTPEYGDRWLAVFRMVLRDNPGIERESLGEKEIDGRKVVGFHISSQPHDFILWGDPKTGLPVRVEMTMGIEGSTKVTLSDFVFNVDMDESLFSLEPPAGYTVTVRNVKTAVSPPEEKDLIEMFREYSKLSDGAFPDSLDFLTTTTIAGKKASIRMMTQNFWEELAPAKGKPNEVQRRKLEELMLKVIEGKLNEEQIKEIAEQMEEYIETHGLKTAEVGEAQPQETEEFGQSQINEILQRVQRGLNFAIKLPPNADAHYVGKGVSFGAADTPIFWYRPKDSKNYRVIYADLSVRDSDTPPNVTEGQPVPAPSSPKDSFIQSPDDLDPEARLRYNEAREKLREADRLFANAMREKEREVPALVLARQLRDEGRDTYLEELAAVELEYKQRSKEAYGHLERWKLCSLMWMGHAQLKEMLNDSDKRPIAIWGLRTYLAQIDVSKPKEAEPLLPANPETMSGEELLQAYETYLQKNVQGSPLEDCQELERTAAPSAEARESMEKFARSFMEGGTCALYVTHHESDPRIQAAKKRRQQAYNDVCAVWQDWAVHEPYYSAL